MNRWMAKILFVQAMILIPLAGALAVSSAQSQQKPVGSVPPPASDAPHTQKMDQLQQEQMKNGSLMIGHMSFALMALEHGVLDVAGKEVDEALKLARTLEKNLPEFKSKDTMLLGKLIHEEENTVRIFYIPVVDGSFLVHGSHTRGREGEKIRETDAKMVHADVSLDMRKAVSSLTDAKAALDKKDGRAAEKAVVDILRTAVTNEVVSSDPLHVVHDNLVLAENLLHGKRYEAARFALKYAGKGLADYNSLVHDPAQKQHAEQMQKDIGALSDQLRKEDPNTLQKAGDTVKGWGENVKKWFTSHPKPGHKWE